MRSAPGMSSFPRASEKGPQVHSKRRVVKTASKISPSTGFAVHFRHEKGKPAELARLPSFATKSIWNAFSRDASSAGDCLQARGGQYLDGIPGSAASCQLAQSQQRTAA